GAARVPLDRDRSDDLAWCEIAHEPLRAGMAERAVERATNLARQAERAAVSLRDVDALDLVRRFAGHLARQPKEPLAGAIGGDLLGHNLGPREREVLVEERVQLLRHVGRLME